MAHDQCVRIVGLFGIGTMKILAETGLDASAVLVKLLHLNEMITQD